MTWLQPVTLENYQHNLDYFVARATWFVGDGVEQRNVHGEGVYFLECASFPHQVKIGTTGNLHNRLSTLRGWYGGAKVIAPMEVVAFAKVNPSRPFERALHISFSQYKQTTPEWFALEPVLYWLASI